MAPRFCVYGIPTPSGMASAVRLYSSFPASWFHAMLRMDSMRHFVSIPYSLKRDSIQCCALIPFRLVADSIRSPRERFHTRLRRDCITFGRFFADPCAERPHFARSAKGSITPPEDRGARSPGAGRGWARYASNPTTPFWFLRGLGGIRIGAVFSRARGTYLRCLLFSVRYSSGVTP